MLARLERELPSDGYLYEPKWDGFRGLAFCVGKGGRSPQPQPAAARELLPGACRIERLDRHGDVFSEVLELEQSLPAP
jgi:hypothetical protein